MTVVVGALMSGTAVLLDLLIDESIQLHLVSGLISGVVPAAAALVVGAILISFLGLLGITYDFTRKLVLPGLLYCFCSGAPLLLDFTYRLKGYVGPVVGWGADGLIQFTRGLAIRVGQSLRKAGTRQSSGLAWMSREIALEALWIKQGVRRVLDLALSIASWPIRSLALLTLRLIERKRQA